ncbi:hypothetical protein Agabi119p4_8601 [Agaricus bisporus var. burnettii]|uniref:Uncharacterized protein n=1 Tax=Agaricus bisporus var. burnettii TaxID=192524 RepID=A0A8H7C7D8_AGABI|nr:hypothetical protein Agabi119p4_8601 [Agaricus bisporus var. burnettii]
MEVTLELHRTVPMTLPTPSCDRGEMKRHVLREFLSASGRQAYAGAVVSEFCPSEVVRDPDPQRLTLWK